MQKGIEVGEVCDLLLWEGCGGEGVKKDVVLKSLERKHMEK